MRTKLHEPRVALAVLGVAYLVLMGAAWVAGEGTGVAMGCIAILVFIPYIVPFAWVGSVEERTKYFDPGWVKVALVLATAVYVALSASWASSVLNMAFAVPSSNFPITHALVALAYLPAQLLGPLVSLAMVLLSLSASLIFLWAFVGSADWKQALRRIGLFLAATVYLGFVYGSTLSLNKNQVFLAQLIAVGVDFDSEHRCANISRDPGAKVAHIGDGNVIVYSGRRPPGLDMTREFTIRRCLVEAEI